MSTYIQDYLKTIHTRKLLSLLNDTRKFGRAILYEKKYNQELGYMEYEYVTADQLKAELVNRPHVPNKLERRKIRQEKAKH